MRITTFSFQNSLGIRFGKSTGIPHRRRYGELALNSSGAILNESWDQIRQTETWLTQDQQRLELFQRWVGLDASNLSKTIEYVKKEILFCVPVREALRLLARSSVIFLNR